MSTEAKALLKKARAVLDLFLEQCKGTEDEMRMKCILRLFISPFGKYCPGFSIVHPQHRPYVYITFVHAAILKVRHCSDTYNRDCTIESLYKIQQQLEELIYQQEKKLSNDGEPDSNDSFFDPLPDFY